MRFFTLADFQHFVLAFFLGLAAALVIYLAFRPTGMKRGDEEGEEEAATPEYPDGLRIGDNPVPPLLVLLFLGFVVWFIFYVIIFGVLGGPV
jgi:hypothetical protein